MIDHKVLASVEDHSCLIKLNGEIRYTDSSALNTFIRKVLSEPSGITKVIIDLRETHYLDSTNLGLLAIIGRNMRKRQESKPLVCTSGGDVHESLINVGLDKVLEIRNQSTLNSNGLSSLGSDSKESEIETQAMILDAHKSLVELDDANKEEFEQVIKLLSEQSQVKNNPENS